MQNPEDVGELAAAAALRAKGLVSRAIGVVINDPAEPGSPTDVVTDDEVRPVDESKMLADLLLVAGGDPEKVPAAYRDAARAHLEMLTARMQAMRDDPTIDVIYADGRIETRHLPPLDWNAGSRRHEYRDVHVVDVRGRAHCPRHRAPRARGFRSPRRALRRSARARERSDPDEPPPALGRLSHLLAALWGAR